MCNLTGITRQWRHLEGEFCLRGEWRSQELGYLLLGNILFVLTVILGDQRYIPCLQTGKLRPGSEATHPG